MFRLSERDLLSAVIERTLDRATPNNNGVGGRRKSDEESSYRSQAKPNRKPVYTHFNVCASGNGWNRGRAIGSISRNRNVFEGGTAVRSNLPESEPTDGI